LGICAFAAATAAADVAPVQQQQNSPAEISHGLFVLNEGSESSIIATAADAAVEDSGAALAAIDKGTSFSVYSEEKGEEHEVGDSDGDAMVGEEQEQLLQQELQEQEY